MCPRKNELSTVPGTVPVADGRADEQAQSLITRLIYMETHTHMNATYVCIYES